MSIKSTSSIFLLVALGLFFVLLPVARADFEEEDIDDSYSRRVGSVADCPEKVEFDGGLKKAIIQADEIEVNDNKCSGSGRIELQDAPNDSPATAYVNKHRNDLDDFLAGNVSGDISCGGANFVPGEQLIFIKPDNKFTITFRDMFVVPTKLEQQDKTFEVSDDDKFVIIGSRCLYGETRLTDRVCFPAHAKVGGKTMNELSIGDEVTTNNEGTVEKVLGFSHKDSNLRTRFVSLHTDVGTLTATPGHYVYVLKGDTGSAATMEKMDSIKEGWRLVHESGTFPVVNKKSYGLQTGVWNPHTKSGSIVVDGFVASCYTKTVEPVTAHALLTPLRAAVGGTVKYFWGLFVAACGVVQS